MSDRSSRQLAHDNLNTLAEIMMNDIHGACSSELLHQSKAVDVEATPSAKRRRGRPPAKGAQSSCGGVAVQQKKKNNKTHDDEDVCFVCFDGGSLVLCDRRGCPKAYHPACIKRDEAFFQSKTKWNCGWHLCNTCQKISYYMCYTCPYSLCKGCTKDADYVSVRGNKGLCGICFRTIMLIENPGQGSLESAQVDFDDKGSWEYLFKVYWVNLKGELSITLEELTRAKNPWKGDEVMPQKLENSGLPTTGICGKGLQAVNPKRRKINIQPKLLTGELTINMDKTLREKNPKSAKERSDPVAAQRASAALNQVDPARAIVHNLGKQLMETSESSYALSSRSSGIGNIELDRIWNYQDPSGKVQGPFSMSQLRKWSISGHFPPDLRIWRVGERQDSSILLTDALHGQYDKKLLSLCSSSTLSQDTKSTLPNAVSYSIGQPSKCYTAQRSSTNADKIQQPIQYVLGLKCNNLRSYQETSRDVIMTSKNGDNHSSQRKNSSTMAVQKESKTSEGNQHSKASNMGSECNDYNERTRNNGVDSQSSSQSAGQVDVNMSEQQRGSNSRGGNDDSPSQPHVFSAEIYERCTLPDQIKLGPGNESKPGQINANGCLCNVDERQIDRGCSIGKHSDSEDYSSQSSEQSRRPPYMVSPLDVWDTKSASAINSYELPRKHDHVSVSVLSRPTAKPNSENSNNQGIDSSQPVSDTRIQDSGPSWSTASSQERGMEQPKEITGEWSQFPPTFFKRNEDLDCSLVSGSTLGPTDMVGDHVATSTSGSDQQRHFSESHNASIPSAWQEIVPEANEFCCLVDESVSDLLAEVEAMESLNANAPGTSTSIMNYGEELTEGSIDDCFSPGGIFCSVAIFSPLDPGKTDALSITGDMTLPSQSTVTDEPNIGYLNSVHDPCKRFGQQFSHSIKVDRDARNSDVSVNQSEFCGVHPSPPSVGDCNTSNTNTSWRHLDSEATCNNWGPVQDNANLSWLNLLKATEPLFGEPIKKRHMDSS